MGRRPFTHSPKTAEHWTQPKDTRSHERRCKPRAEEQSTRTATLHAPADVMNSAVYARPIIVHTRTITNGRELAACARAHPAPLSRLRHSARPSSLSAPTFTDRRMLLDRARPSRGAPIPPPLRHHHHRGHGKSHILKRCQRLSARRRSSTYPIMHTFRCAAHLLLLLPTTVGPTTRLRSSAHMKCVAPDRVPWPFIHSSSHHPVNSLPSE